MDPPSQGLALLPDPVEKVYVTPDVEMGLGSCHLPQKGQHTAEEGGGRVSIVFVVMINRSVLASAISKAIRADSVRGIDEDTVKTIGGLPQPLNTIGMVYRVSLIRGFQAYDGRELRVVGRVVFLLDNLESVVERFRLSDVSVPRSNMASDKKRLAYTLSWGGVIRKYGLCDLSRCSFGPLYFLETCESSHCLSALLPR